MPNIIRSFRRGFDSHRRSLIDSVDLTPLSYLNSIQISAVLDGSRTG